MREVMRARRTLQVLHTSRARTGKVIMMVSHCEHRPTKFVILSSKFEMERVRSPGLLAVRTAVCHFRRRSMPVSARFKPQSGKLMCFCKFICVAAFVAARNLRWFWVGGCRRCCGCRQLCSAMHGCLSTRNIHLFMSYGRGLLGHRTSTAQLLSQQCSREYDNPLYC